MDVIEQKILSILDSRAEELQALAQDLFDHAEQGYHEYRTAQVVSDCLKKLGLETREGLAITGLRTIAAGKGVVMAADKWGKVKTASQMVWICYGLVMGFCFHSLSIHGDTAWGMFFAFQAGMVVVLCTTLFSGWNYLWNNRGLFAQMK